MLCHYLFISAILSHPSILKWKKAVAWNCSNSLCTHICVLQKNKKIEKLKKKEFAVNQIVEGRKYIMVKTCILVNMNGGQETIGLQ